MNPIKASVYHIIVSIVFGVAMLISPTLFGDTGYSQLITFLLISVWFIPFFYFNNVTNQTSN